MGKISPTLLLVMIFLPIAAQATTGAQLREDCAAYDEKPNAAAISSNLMRMMACNAYISGVLDVPAMYDTRGSDYCVPDGTTVNHTQNAVRDYLRRTPQ